MSTHRGRRTGLVALAAAVSLMLSACTDDYVDPYVDAPPLRPAVDILQDLDLAAVGLRAYDCDLFEAEVARCYDSRTWGSVNSGRMTLAHVHRELTAAGARFYGGADHSRAEFVPAIDGLDLACYYDYQAADMALRVTVVGPSGERAPCQDGLPPEGVSEVWIIGVPFDAAEVYQQVEYPPGFEELLATLPPVVTPVGDVYGGPASTVDGYYGPELPPVAPGATGVVLLPETVSIRDGVARGLVQYVGDGAVAVGDDGAATGAWGVIVAAGDNFGSVPMVIRPGESAPFEFKVPRKTKIKDLTVLPNWVTVTEDWRGVLYLTGPEANKKCADGVQVDGKAVKALKPSKSEKCWVVTGQTQTLIGDRYVVDALVATFNPNGTVRDVYQPYLLRGANEEGDPGLVRLNTVAADVQLVWVAKRLNVDQTGVWMRYAKVEDLTGSPAYTRVTP